MQAWRAPAAVALLALASGLFALTWGLPSRERVLRLMPAERADDPDLHRRMEEGRREIYEERAKHGRLPTDFLTEAAEFPKGWETPPGRLLHAYRSFFLRTANPDEQKNLSYLAAMKPRKLEFAPYGIDYGGAYLYPLGAYLGGLSVVRVIRITGDLKAYLKDVGKIGNVFLAGRVFNVLCFVGCALLMLLLGSRAGGEPGGLAAALLFIFSPVVVLVEHTMNPYGWATLWFLAGCLGLSSYLDSGARSRLRLGAAGIGLAIGSSIAFWPAAAAAAAPAFAAKDLRKEWKDVLLRAAEAVAVIGVVFVVTNPYFIFRFGTYSDQLVYLMRTDSFSPSAGRLWAFFAEFLGRNWGHLLTLAALGAVAALPFTGGRRRDDRFFSALFLFGFLHLAGRTADYAHGRHFLPFFALGALAAGRLLWGPVRARSKAAAWALSALLLAHSGSMSLSYLLDFRAEAAGRGTRMVAGSWLEHHLPAGSVVGLVSPPEYSDTPPIRFDRHDLVLFAEPAHLKGRELPEYLILSELRENPRLDPLLDQSYTAAAAFEPRQYFPWARVRGAYTLANPRIRIFKRN